MSTTDVWIRRCFPFAAICVMTVLTFTVVALVGFLILPLVGY